MKKSNIIDRSNIIGIILVGTFILFSLFFVLLLISLVVVGHSYVLDRILVVSCVLLYLVVVWLNYKKHLLHRVAILIILLYLIISTLIIFVWGINTPVGILLFCFVILLTSLTLGSRYIIPITSVIIFVLFFIQILVSINFIRPETTHFVNVSTFADTLTYAIIFGIFALLGWIYGTQIEQLLESLKLKNISISKDLEEEKEKLRQSQREELINLYQFAELGQNATILLHDLANQITTLSLDLDVDSYDEDTLLQSKVTMKNIESLISEANSHLTPPSPKSFNLIDKISEHILDIQGYAKSHHVNISLTTTDKEIILYGDQLRFKQIIDILLSNAIQAYEKSKKKSKKLINISTYVKLKYVYISIQDFGIGIDTSQRKILFKNIQTTKKSGHGIGLYISNKIMNHHFKGSLTLDPSTSSTRFILKFPISR